MNSSINDDESLIRVSTVDYISFVKLSYEGCVKMFNRFDANYRHNYSFPMTFLENIGQFCYLRTIDMVCVLSLAVFWTYLRIFLTNNCFLVNIYIHFLLRPILLFANNRTFVKLYKCFSGDVFAIKFI